MQTLIKVTDSLKYPFWSLNLLISPVNIRIYFQIKITEGVYQLRVCSYAEVIQDLLMLISIMIKETKITIQFNNTYSHLIIWVPSTHFQNKIIFSLICCTVNQPSKDCNIRRMKILPIIIFRPQEYTPINNTQLSMERMLLCPIINLIKRISTIKHNLYACLIVMKLELELGMYMVADYIIKVV